MADHIHVYDSDNPHTDFRYSGGGKTGAVGMTCACGHRRLFSPFNDRQRIIKINRRLESKYRQLDVEDYVRLEPRDQGYVWYFQKHIQFKFLRGNPYPDDTIECAEWSDGFRDAILEDRCE